MDTALPPEQFERGLQSIAATRRNETGDSLTDPLLVPRQGKEPLLNTRFKTGEELRSLKNDLLRESAENQGNIDRMRTGSSKNYFKGKYDDSIDRWRQRNDQISTLVVKLDRALQGRKAESA